MSYSRVKRLVASLCVLLTGVPEICRATNDTLKHESTELSSTNTTTVLYDGESQRIVAGASSRPFVDSCESKECSHHAADKQITSESRRRNVIVRVDTEVNFDQDNQGFPDQVKSSVISDHPIAHTDRLYGYPEVSPPRLGPLNNCRDTHGVEEADYKSAIKVNTAVSIHKANGLNLAPRPLYPPSNVDQPTGIFGADRNPSLVPQTPYQHRQTPQPTRPSFEGNFVHLAPHLPTPEYNRDRNFIPNTPVPYLPGHNLGDGVYPPILRSFPEYNSDDNGVTRFQSQPRPIPPIEYPTGSDFRATPSYRHSDDHFLPGVQWESGDPYQRETSYRPFINRIPGQADYSGTTKDSNPWRGNPPHISPGQYYSDANSANLKPSQYEIKFNPLHANGAFQYHRDVNGRALYQPMQYADSRAVASDVNRTPSRSSIYSANGDLTGSFQSQSRFAVTTPGQTETNRRINRYNLQSLPYFEPSYQNRYQGESAPPQLVWYPREYKYNPVEFRDIPNMQAVSSTLIKEYVNRSPTRCKRDC